MTWFNASEHFAIGVAARHRVDELRSAASLAAAHDSAVPGPTACPARTLRGRLALMLGLLGVAAASCVGCATGTRPVAVDAGANAGSVSASPAVTAPQIPVCRGMGSYNRAANLCVSEGA